MIKNSTKALAAVQYLGIPGITRDCQNAVIQLLQCRVKISMTKILTNSNKHCLLLTDEMNRLIAIKSGFASGYSGEGPKGLSYVLQLLEYHDSMIDEYEVPDDVFHRLNSSALTVSDIDNIVKTVPVRPFRWTNYVFDKDIKFAHDGEIWNRFPPIIPLAIVDSRISDLALDFWENPNDNLITGYKRLETQIRNRTGINEHGTKLFSKAFRGPLSWKDIQSSEREGRANLFTSVFMAYRNPRAHQEYENSEGDYLTEFLLLNHLYIMERDSIIQGGDKSSK